METKFCHKCSTDKSIEEFHKEKRRGVQSKCKSCMKEYTNLNALSIKVSEKTCIICKTEKNIDCFNKDSSRKDGYYPKCKDCINKRRQELYTVNKPKIQERNNKWRKSNQEKINKYNSIKTKKRRKEDPVFKLVGNIRHVIRESFKRACKGNYKKSQKSEDILGCTISEFIEHLVSLFTEGMSLENHGNCEECWHIDHKIPISFAKTEEDVIRLNHYTNLQPMWGKENMSKGNRFSS